MPTSKVTMILDGLIVLAAKLGEDNGEAGILKFHPLHDVTIHVTKFFTNSTTNESDVSEKQKELTLVIEPPRRITARDTTEVNRMVHPADHFESIGWFVDLEDGKKFYRPGLEAKRKGFEPIIKFNGGELYTAEPVNDSLLEVFRGFSPNPERIGRVALKLGIDFANATRALFKDDQGNTIFDSNIDGAGTNYKIQVSNNRMPHGGTSIDGDLYYSALAGNIGLDKRITFRSVSNRIRQLEDFLDEMKTRSPRNPEFEKEQEATLLKLEAAGDQRAGPEAACFPAYLSVSKMT